MTEVKAPKKKKKKRRLRKSVLIIPLLIAAIVYAALRIPKESTAAKLRALGYDNDAITAIQQQDLTDLILENQYYSEYLSSSIKNRTLNREYIVLYTTADASRQLNEADFLLCSRLKDAGYEEDQLANLFASLKTREILPLLIFDYQWNEQNYIDDVLENRSESTAEIIVLDGSYHTNYRLAEEAENPDEINVLVNKNIYLPDDFVPKKLTSVTTEYAVDGKRLVKEAANAAVAMCTQGLSDGNAFFITAAYMDYSSISNTYDRFVYANGEEMADLMIGKPGFSEYQTGLAINVAATYEKEEDFSLTGCYEWLQKNAAKYGFIERFKAGQEEITGCEADPSYYRYLGTELAGKVKKSGLTYDEYYCLLLKGWYDETNKPSDSIAEKAETIICHE